MPDTQALPYNVPFNVPTVTTNVQLATSIIIHAFVSRECCYGQTLSTSMRSELLECGYGSSC